MDIFSIFLKMELLAHVVIPLNFLRYFKSVFQSDYYLNVYTHITFQIRKNQNTKYILKISK